MPSTRVEEAVVVGGGTVVEVDDTDPGAVAVVLTIEELVADAEEPLGLQAATTATRMRAKTCFTNR